MKRAFNETTTLAVPNDVLAPARARIFEATLTINNDTKLRFVAKRKGVIRRKKSITNQDDKRTNKKKTNECISILALRQQGLQASITAQQSDSHSAR